MKVEAKIKGKRELERLRRDLKKMAKGLNRAETEKVLHAFVEDIHMRMISGIKREGGDFRYRFRRLNKAYLNKKVNMGLRQTQLLATEEYIDSIVVDNTTLKLKPGYHTKAKLSYSELANYLENGTKRMEPIPHWMPTVKKARRYVPLFWRRYIRGLI